jgi:hypothetical protein
MFSRLGEAKERRTAGIGRRYQEFIGLGFLRFLNGR